MATGWTFVPGKPGDAMPAPVCITGSGCLSCNHIFGPLGATCANAVVMKQRQNRTRAEYAAIRRMGETNLVFTARTPYVYRNRGSYAGNLNLGATLHHFAPTHDEIPKAKSVARLPARLHSRQFQISGGL